MSIAENNRHEESNNNADEASQVVKNSPVPVLTINPYKLK